MSSFFDKAKDKATQLASQAKDKVDEQQNKRKADDLLDDIGRIVYRQRTTGTVEADDDATIDALVAELTALAAAPAPPAAPAAATTTPEPQAFPTPE